ncbi:SipW-dependent-type signal peptide-containing protein, partial [Brevibacterium aurantiacum]
MAVDPIACLRAHRDRIYCHRQNQKPEEAMSRASRQRPKQKRRIQAFFAGLLLVMIVLGLSGVHSTLAAWTDEDEATGAFTAGKIQPVQNLKCIDSDDGLLPLLLKTEVQLDWDRPDVPDDVAIEYVVSWQPSLIGDSGSRTITENSYVYKSR